MVIPVLTGGFVGVKIVSMKVRIPATELDSLALRGSRLAKRWTLTRLAEESGISISYLSKLESGRAREPTMPILFKLALALGITTDSLVRKTHYEQ